MALTREQRRQLVAILGEDGVLDDPTHRRIYDGDAYTLDRFTPDAIVLPREQDQVLEVVRWCNRHQIPYAPRGAGTGLSGGCLTLRGGLQIGLARMRRILEIDPFLRVARVEPGVVNLDLGIAAAAHGLTFAPDPSSQAACTLGGNFAGNSGGPHCLKYGVTLPHILGATVVTPEGELLKLGGRHDPGPGVDLLGLLVGSEGTAGLAVELTLRLTPLPKAVRTLLAVFPTVTAAAHSVSRVIARGVIPAAMELIDAVMIRAVERAFQLGFPQDAGAVLLIELDGAAEDLPAQERVVEEVCRQYGCRQLEVAKNERERALLWKARKHAFGAVGRISPDYATQDGVVPRAMVPAICDFIADAARRYGLTVGVVLHAGDGNIHPAILYDRRDADSVERALRVGGEILQACIDMGGSPTGEHGVGMEKREFLPLIFSADEMDAQRQIREALDSTGLCNPLKVLPTGGECAELRVAGRQVAL